MAAPFHSRYSASPAAALDSTAADLLRFLESLNGDECIDLVNALVDKRGDALDVFRAAPGDEVVATAARYLAQLGEPDRRKFCRAVEHLIRESRSALSAGVGASSLKRMLRALRITTELADPPLLGLLAGLMRDRELPSELRVSAANSLANHASAVPDDTWLGMNLDELPEAAPSVVRGLALRSPALGLSMLAAMAARPARPQSLEYPLRRTVRRLAENAGGLESLARTHASAAPWLSDLINLVLGFEEFSHLMATASAEVPELSFAAWRSRFSRYLEGEAVTFEVESWGPTAAAPFWEEVIADWQAAPGSEEAACRLIEALPRVLSRNLLTILLGHFVKLASEGSASRLKVVLWHRILEAESAITTAATSIEEPDRRLFETYVQCLRHACHDRRFGAEALKLRVHYSLITELPGIIREVLDEDFIDVALCWTLVARKLGEREADQVFFTVIRRLSASDQIDNRSPFMESEQRVAEKLYAFMPQLFQRGRNIGEAALILTQDAVGAKSTDAMFSRYM